jgi:hypothetical protein
VLLSGAGLWWYKYKEGLRDEGAQECVQEIERATLIALENALAAEKAAAADLRAKMDAVAAANQEAIARRNAAESTIASLRKQVEEQRENDETYREWSDTPLPDGVADRLRQARRSATTDHDN